VTASTANKQREDSETC